MSRCLFRSYRPSCQFVFQSRSFSYYLQVRFSHSSSWSIDKSLPLNYRPISNLNTISKILERLFLNRVQSSIVSSPNFNQSQNAYRPRHSTETCLLATLDNIFSSSDSGNSTLLVSLDFSAAFDSIDHAILLGRPSTQDQFRF